MITVIRAASPPESEWAPCALQMTKGDYELLDYLMACMAYDMGEFSASLFNAHCLSYLIATYGEHFTIVGNKLYKQHLREKHTYAQ